MKTKILFPLIATVAAAIAGCGTPGHYVETGGRENIVSVNDVNIQDFISAGNAMTASLLSSGILDRVPKPPAILAMSRIVNNTGQQIDTDLLTKRIRVALLQSGKAVTTTTFGQVEDPLAKSIQQEQVATGNQPATPLPNFTLSGKIIQVNAASGDYKQATFSFQLSMTDQRGLAVWEDQKEITKQGSKPGIGF
jgi:uncharacterized protein (TIGR02722 family)